jgi:hypothetical protein
VIKLGVKIILKEITIASNCRKIIFATELEKIPLPQNSELCEEFREG